MAATAKVFMVKVGGSEARVCGMWWNGWSGNQAAFATSRATQSLTGGGGKSTFRFFNRSSNQKIIAVLSSIITSLQKSHAALTNADAFRAAFTALRSVDPKESAYAEAAFEKNVDALSVAPCFLYNTPSWYNVSPISLRPGVSSVR